MFQKATVTACIGMKQNLIDTAVNEWRNCLLCCVRIVGQHRKQFYCRQFKYGQLDEFSPKVSEIWTKCVCMLYVN